MSYKIAQIWNPELTVYHRRCLDGAQSSWYHEESKGSKKLLICVGDSWTWGDSLGQTSQDLDDREYRVHNIYGHLLAQQLDSDFANIALPGYNNFWMWSQLSELLPTVIDRYEQIAVVVTLTENCREWASANWPIRVDFSQTPSSLADLMKEFEARMFHYFKQTLDAFDKVQWIVARNFTFSFEENISILGQQHVPKTWMQIINEHQGLEGYPGNLRILSQMAYDPIARYLRHPDVRLFDQFKPELFEIFCQMSDAIDCLDLSELNHRVATRHPTEKAHQLWADYLLTHLE
jgi:hypothetical protein